MSFSITGILVKALTLWLMLALSHVGESEGSGLKLGLFKSGHGHKSHGSAGAAKINHGGESYGSPHASKRDKGRTHGSKANLITVGLGKNKSPKPSPPKTSPTPVSKPNSPSNTSSPLGPSGLQVGFYKGMCPNKLVDVEATITTKVQEQFRKDPTILPALLRLQFHDCFVHGCDASILIDGPSTEKAAGPNLSVRGYELIEALKASAEAECPNVVSCADIIAIATKEVIKMGGGPEYLVQTGRKDGVVSRAQDVNLPSPFSSVTQTIAAFADKKFTPEEMVVLLGCHTVGISHCTFFQDRVHQGTSQFDPLMDPILRQQLKSTCPQGTSSNNFTNLDQNPQSSSKLDNSFFVQIQKQRGILSIDQALARDSQTSGFVRQFAESGALFNTKLASAMVKLQALEVLTGNQGQIRKVCSRIN